MSGSMRLSGQLGVEMTSQRTGRQTRKEKKTIVEDVKIQQCETPALLHQAQRFMCSCSAVYVTNHLPGQKKKKGMMRLKHRKRIVQPDK